MNDIFLGVKRDIFRIDDPTSEHADAKFKEIREQVLKRDKLTCFYCGFKSNKFQEVHHIDDDHSNNNIRNLVTVCPICHACKHVGFSGVKNKAFLIYYPNMSQVEINYLIKILWFGFNSKIDENNKEAIEIKNKCIDLIKIFDNLKNTAEDRLGTSNPSILANEILLKLNDEEYEKRQEKLKGFLLIPRMGAYKKQIEYWQDTVFKNLPLSTWSDIAKQNYIK